jgi:hypothetical protein
MSIIDLVESQPLALDHRGQRMKFSVPVTCPSCSTEFSAPGVGEERIPTATCPKCGSAIHIIDQLSVSVVAERLLYRSQSELASGDYTFSIVSSAMAVEAAYTQAFMKWKSIEHMQATGENPTEKERETWEEEYRDETRGNFEESAKFVAKFLGGKTFNQFVDDSLARESKAAIIKAGLPPNKDQLRPKYIHTELFRRRNRIMHWGMVDYQQGDASAALKAAQTAFAVLKALDKEKYEVMEKAFREQATQI